jgi:hypothetical protein
MVDSGAALWRLQSLLIRGGGAPDVHVSLVLGGGQGLAPVVVEAGGPACDNPPKKIPYYRLNQSTLVIKQ